MRFRLVPKLVTLNDFERRNDHFLRFSLNLVAFRAEYIKVVENKPMLFVTKM